MTPEVEKAKTKMVNAIQALDDHIKRMQSESLNYLTEADGKRSNEEFISRIIYHLDGPDQRKAQSLATDVLNKEDDLPLSLQLRALSTLMELMGKKVLAFYNGDTSRHVMEDWAEITEKWSAEIRGIEIHRANTQKEGD